MRSRIFNYSNSTDIKEGTWQPMLAMGTNGPTFKVKSTLSNILALWHMIQANGRSFSRDKRKRKYISTEKWWEWIQSIIKIDQFTQKEQSQRALQFPNTRKLYSKLKEKNCNPRTEGLELFCRRWRHQQFK